MSEWLKQQTKAFIDAQEDRLFRTYGGRLEKAIENFNNDPRIEKFLFGDDEPTFETLSDINSVKKIAALIETFSNAIDPQTKDVEELFTMLLSQSADWSEEEDADLTLQAIDAIREYADDLKKGGQRPVYH